MCRQRHYWYTELFSIFDRKVNVYQATQKTAVQLWESRENNQITFFPFFLPFSLALSFSLYLFFSPNNSNIGCLPKELRKE